MNDIAVSDVKHVGILRPIVKPDELIEAQNEVSMLIVKGLTRGTDYGMVPGTRGKETLFKPGAERIQKAFGCHTEFEIIEKEIDHNHENQWTKYGKTEYSQGLYRYVVKASVFSPQGYVVGEGMGSCSSLENKYISRPRDLENTILKMAQKRAKVAATLDAFALSDRFTQDLEDIVEVAAPVVKAKEGFDPGNALHRAKLVSTLRAKGITEELWDSVAERMKGRASDAIDTVIQEVTS